MSTRVLCGQRSRFVAASQPTAAAVVVGVAVCVLWLTGCGEPGATSAVSAHPATTPAVVHTGGDPGASLFALEGALKIVRYVMWSFGAAAILVPVLVVLCSAVLFAAMKRDDRSRIRRKAGLQGPLRGCVVAYTSTTERSFVFELQELSPAQWRVFVASHLFNDASDRKKYYCLRLKPGRPARDVVCWSQRIADPFDAYKVAVLWAESISGLLIDGFFVPPSADYSTDPPPGSEIETLTAPYRSIAPRFGAEFDHSTRAGLRFRFGLRDSGSGWLIHILSQPDYANRSTTLQDTHRVRSARGEILVCWTEQLMTPLEAYRVAVMWAEATCDYMTTGTFTEVAELDDMPVPDDVSALAESVRRLASDTRGS